MILDPNEFTKYPLFVFTDAFFLMVYVVGSQLFLG